MWPGGCGHGWSPVIYSPGAGHCGHVSLRGHQALEERVAARWGLVGWPCSVDFMIFGGMSTDVKKQELSSWWLTLNHFEPGALMFFRMSTIKQCQVVGGCWGFCMVLWASKSQVSQIWEVISFFCQTQRTGRMSSVLFCSWQLGARLVIDVLIEVQILHVPMIVTSYSRLFQVLHFVFRETHKLWRWVLLLLALLEDHACCGAPFAGPLVLWREVPAGRFANTARCSVVVSALLLKMVELASSSAIFEWGKWSWTWTCPNFYEEPIDLGIPMGTIFFCLSTSKHEFASMIEVIEVWV